eukprot:CAMPEP_0185598114 /NCGR_PEP_ID=MMETSP0434-20130131/81796_1 /TAXON_ID=626734 ORGANISM="Favella taraikaensis, Strain Fe Narragansett Bay" /NCGR_SAMPLE_ID=MMETSP0434 /ASSEMBLY_ACC=CAM_ASM_000379 /LENGTH=48 /DNA_ID= /DNA_START= /DNA_END= /DNA_ORIENTATION=
MACSSGFPTWEASSMPDSDIKVAERQTYGMLEWLSDVGGLFDALAAIG